MLNMQLGKTALAFFWDEASRTRALVHGDNFVVAVLVQ